MNFFKLNCLVNKNQILQLESIKFDLSKNPFLIYNISEPPSILAIKT